MRLTLASRSQGRGCRRISLSPRQPSWYVPARGEPAAPLLPGVAAPALPPRVRRARLRSRQGTAPCAEWGGGPAATCGPTGREGLLLPFWFRPNSERTCPGSFRHLQAPPGPPQLALRRAHLAPGAEAAVLAAATTRVRQACRLSGSDTENRGTHTAAFDLAVTFSLRIGDAGPCWGVGGGCGRGRQGSAPVELPQGQQGPCLGWPGSGSRSRARLELGPLQQALWGPCRSLLPPGAARGTACGSLWGYWNR